MNKTVIYITFAALVAIGLVAYVVLLALGVPDTAVAGFAALFLNVLGLATLAAGTFYSLGKQDRKLETIEKNTNGRLEARDTHILDLEQQLRAAGIEPQLARSRIADAEV